MNKTKLHTLFPFLVEAYYLNWKYLDGETPDGGNQIKIIYRLNEGDTLEQMIFSDKMLNKEYEMMKFISVDDHINNIMK